MQVEVQVEEVEATDGGSVLQLAVRLRGSRDWLEGREGAAWWRRRCCCWCCCCWW